MIAILGSGFGLYGYLPALVGGCGQQVALPERYRVRFNERPELTSFSGSVRWKRDEEAALDEADGVVIALWPVDQWDWMLKALARENVRRFILEKPLAPSPEGAARTLSKLAGSARAFRLGYTFRYTAWARQIMNVARSMGHAGSISIRWVFLAHHFRVDRQNWKRRSASGGGAIRFYGMQLVALLAEMGYRTVNSSQSAGRTPEEMESWMASFTGPGLPRFDVFVDTRGALDEFRVETFRESGPGAGNLVISLSGPFEATDTSSSTAILDRRVPALTQLCRSLWGSDANDEVWYEATNDLWRRIEETNRPEIIQA